MRLTTALFALTFVAAGALAADLPTLKSGAWEVTRSSPGDTSGKRHLTTMCLDESVQAQMRDFGMGMAKDMCTKNDTRVEGSRVLSSATCKMGATTLNTESVMTFAPTSYHTEISATYDPPMANLRESKTVLDGKWIGPCKAGQQPGDMTLETGQTLNMRSMMQQPPAAPAKK